MSALPARLCLARTRSTSALRTLHKSSSRALRPPPHSGLIPAAFMIGSSRASSLSRKALISAGEVGQGVAPRSA